MKRFFVTLASLLAVVTMATAQDLSQVTEIYNNGAAALSAGDKAGALDAFQQAMSLAAALGEEGKEVVGNCKGIIPTIVLSMAKDNVKALDFDAAIAGIAEAAKLAKEYGNDDVLFEAEELLPQVNLRKANSLFRSKDYAGAAEMFKSILATDPTNGAAALTLGASLNALGDVEGALAAFEQAAANGKEADAKKQLSNLYLKKAAASLKAKKYADAVADAVKSNEILESGKALRIAGQASQLQNKNADAIKYFEKFLEVAPNDSSAGQIAYTVGALYQQAKNNAKAKEFYQKAISDPKYGAEAKKLFDSLK